MASRQKLAAPPTDASDMRLGRSSNPSGSSTGSTENTSISPAWKPRALSASMAARTDCVSPNSAVRNILVFPDSDHRKQFAKNQVEQDHGGERRHGDGDLHPGRRIEARGGSQTRVRQG